MAHTGAVVDQCLALVLRIPSILPAAFDNGFYWHSQLRELGVIGRNENGTVYLTCLQFLGDDVYLDPKPIFKVCLIWCQLEEWDIRLCENNLKVRAARLVHRQLLGKRTHHLRTGLQRRGVDL